MVLEGPIAELREREVRLLVESAEQIGKMLPDGPADRQRLIDAADDLREAFLMVTIIGEFNAGKSTFVNALLGEPLLPMGITPTTDVIEVIRYAPSVVNKPTMRGDAVREWGHPNTGSAGVAIVDTPGTGSVFKKHEAIAKSFLHRSDLVIFLVSAKRAFAETERLYLELAKGYGKKIIVVVNQSDLLDPKELDEVKKFVQQQIDQLLDLRPPIFMVSAKKALQAAKPGGLFANLGARRESQGAEDYGMNAVRAHLHEVFEQVSPAKQKLLTRLDLLRSVVGRHHGAIQGRLSLIGQDTDAAEALRREIELQAANLDRRLTGALDEVRGVLTGVQERGNQYIEKNINVIRATLRGVDRTKLAEEFEHDVLGDALMRISSTQEHYVNALVDGSRAYWRGVIDRLGKLDALLREESVGMDAATYAEQRAALQSALTLANIEMKGYSDNQVIASIQSHFDENVRGFTYSAVGSVGGVVAVIVSLATPGALALYPLAAIGFTIGLPVTLGAGFFALRYWRKAVRDARAQLESQIKELESSYRQALTRLTNDERNRLVQYGNQILSPVFSQLQELAGRYRDQQGQLNKFTASADEIGNLLGALSGGT
jgi:small GTP-binding protein